MNKVGLELFDLISIFEEIKSVSSKNDKESILRQHKKNTLFVEMLDFLYNPFVMTGLGVKKLVKFSHFRLKDEEHPLQDIKEAMDYLKRNNTGTDLNAMLISDFINQHDSLFMHDFLQEFFSKSYKCGITSSTINKVYGKNFIPKFEVMLANKFEEKQDKLTGNFAVTTKLDGIRCVATNQNGNISFFTRTGQAILGLEELTEEISKLDYDNIMLDGELIIKNIDNLSSDDLFRATQKIVRKDGVKKDVEFHIFDTTSLEEFFDGKSKKTYVERMYFLHNDLDLEGSNLLKLVDMLYFGDDKSKIDGLLTRVIAEGKEGLMVNKANGLYVTKRTDNLLKVKKMHTIDLRVTGVQEGTGKNKGKLGALIVDYKGNDVGVGSGFTDADRKIIWDDQDAIIDMIVEVQYFEESNNEDGGISLRFPVFKGIRYDKDEVSYA